METKMVWCVKIHIVSDCETINNEVRLFQYLQDAETAFNEIVEEEREIANNKEYVIDYDDNRLFEAYEEGYYTHNHICINLFQIEIK